MKSQYLKVGWAVSNLGYTQAIEDIIREEHPKWNDDKVEREKEKILKKATLCNGANKKPKKAKKPKDK